MKTITLETARFKDLPDELQKKELDKTKKEYKRLVDIVGNPIFTLEEMIDLHINKALYIKDESGYYIFKLEKV